jgi:Zn-dependent protease
MVHHVADLFIWYLVFVFSTTCHEAAHALVAQRGGDETAYVGGHVTLDPLPHIVRSPFGMLVIPVISYLFNGWMMGWASVPVNAEWGRAHPRRAALMAFAGPLANLLLATIAFFALRTLLGSGVLARPTGPIGISELAVLPEGIKASSPLGFAARFLSVMLGLNVMLGLFNLVPIPPLDGASIVEGAAPRASAPFFKLLREVPGIELLGLLAAWSAFGYVAAPALSWVARMLHT